MKLICKNCACEFDKPQEQKTCSMKCGSELKKKHNREKRKCAYCNNEFEVKKTSTTTMCSDQCRKDWALIPENKTKRLDNGRKAMLEKHGQEFAFKLEGFHDKSKKTRKEKYGDENFVNAKKAMKTKESVYGDAYYNNMEKNKETKKENHGNENYNNRGKALETTRELYGVDYAIQKDEFKKKQKETNLELYGVEHPLQNKYILEKKDKTNIEIYGTKYPSELESVKIKTENTNLKKIGVKSLLCFENIREKGKYKMIEKYGTTNVMSIQEIKDKRKQTFKEKYGKDHPMQTREVLEKNHLSGLRIKKYKDTKITYQGSYEKYFLELIEEKGLLSEVQQGQSFEYEHNGDKHIYHTDFTFRDKQIEIKSGWTYNKNGADKQLQESNESKWKVVKDLVVLIGKSEVLGFVKAL